jgi:hypothetical protein
MAGRVVQGEFSRSIALHAESAELKDQMMKVFDQTAAVIAASKALCARAGGRPVLTLLRGGAVAAPIELEKMSA